MLHFMCKNLAQNIRDCDLCLSDETVKAVAQKWAVWILTKNQELTVNLHSNTLEMRLRTP